MAKLPGSRRRQVVDINVEEETAEAAISLTLEHPYTQLLDIPGYHEYYYSDLSQVSETLRRRLA